MVISFALSLFLSFSFAHSHPHLKTEFCWKDFAFVVLALPYFLIIFLSGVVVGGKSISFAYAGGRFHYIRWWQVSSFPLTLSLSAWCANFVLHSKSLRKLIFSWISKKDSIKKLIFKWGRQRERETHKLKPQTKKKKKLWCFCKWVSKG